MYCLYVHRFIHTIKIDMFNISTNGTYSINLQMFYTIGSKSKI